MSLISLAVVVPILGIGAASFAFLWVQKIKQLKKYEEAGLKEDIIQKIKDYSGGINGLFKNIEEIQELEKYKRLGTPKDFESFKQLRDDCQLIGLKRDLIVNLRNEEITVPFIISEKTRLESKINQKDRKIFDLEQSIVVKDRELFLNEHQIKELKDEKRSVIEELEKRDSELSDWGFTDSLKAEIKNRQLRNIPDLLNKLLEAEKKNERWSILANNDPLEVVEEKYKKSREKIEKIKGFSRNIKEAGNQFEDWFYEGFKSFFGTYNSEVECSRQDNGSDFVILFDSENSKCKVIVECKSILDDIAGLYSLSPSESDAEQISKNKRDQIEAGIIQIKRYLKKHEAQIGILITSFDFEEEYEEIRKDPKNNIDFPFFIVKDEAVFQLLLLIQCVNKYSIPVEKPVVDIESIKDKEYELIPFLREVIGAVKGLQIHHNNVLKKAQFIHKHLETFNKYSGKLKQQLDLLVEVVDRKKRFIDVWEGKETLRLDSSVEVQEEEFEAEEEEIEKSDSE